MTIIAVIFIYLWGLKLGIDFTGGSLMEIKYTKERPAIEKISSELTSLDLGNIVIQPIGNDGMVLRFKHIDEPKHQEIIKKLNELSAPVEVNKVEEKKDAKNNETIKTSDTSKTSEFEEVRFDAVGPSVGQDLKRKSFNAIFFVLLGIILYISYSFRKVSKPIASWKYGASAIIALIHDTIIVIGIFALLGKIYNIEVNAAFVAAILTVLGYSVHDTIVVFDRIRENLPKSNENFENTINTSLNQTIARSLITSGTVLLVLLAIAIYGGSSIRDFSLALLFGIFFGTYSSIFLASPLLILWEKFQKK